MVFVSVVGLQNSDSSQDTFRVSKPRFQLGMDEYRYYPSVSCAQPPLLKVSWRLPIPTADTSDKIIWRPAHQFEMIMCARRKDPSLFTNIQPKYRKYQYCCWVLTWILGTSRVSRRARTLVSKKSYFRKRVWRQGYGFRCGSRAWVVVFNWEGSQASIDSKP